VKLLLVQNQEMRRLYQAGEVGEFKYGEAEYVHPDPAAVKLGRSVGVTHWRNCTPRRSYPQKPLRGLLRSR